MAQTIYTSARNVDVRNCEPQPLIKSNYLAEFRTKLEQAKARQNLGVKDDIIWGNITGDLTLQEDLIECIRQALEYEDGLPVQQKISQIKSELDNLEDTISSNILFTVTTYLNQYDLEGMKDSVEGFKEDIKNFNATIEGFKQGYIDIKYNSERSNEFVAPNTIGGITKGTKVESLRNKKYDEILDMLLFPITVRDLIYPTFTVSGYQSYVKAGDTVQFKLTYTKNDAGEQHTFKLNDSEITSPYELSINETTTFNFICEYSEGNYIKDSNGEDTDKKVSAGILPKSVTITVQKPIHYGEVGNLIEDLQRNREYIIFSAKQPCIKVPSEYSINIFAEVAGNYLEVEYSGWDITEENGYTIYTQKTAYPENVNHKIEF